MKFLNEVHVPWHKCNTCDSAFDKSGELKRHIAAVHEGKKPYQCKICNECFFINSERKKHIEEVHDGKNVFKCSICKDEFETFRYDDKVIDDIKFIFALGVSSVSSNEDDGGVLHDHEAE